MTKIKLDDIGKVEIGKKLEANFKISSKEFFDKFPTFSSKLSKDSKKLIVEAIDKKNKPRLRKHEDGIRRYFEDIKKEIEKQKQEAEKAAAKEMEEEKAVEEEGEEDEQMGFDEEEEKEEEEETEELESTEMDEPEVDYESGQETFDEDTGESEGVITMDENRTEDTNLVPVKIEENLEVHYEHDGTPSVKDQTKMGKIIVENIAKNDRLWDIDLTLEKEASTSLKEATISIQELDPEMIFDEEYQINVEVRPELAIKEFISTINDPEVASYSLVVDTENEIYTKIVISNTSDKKLENIEIQKEIAELFSDATVKEASTGEALKAEVDGKEIISWKIDSLEEEGEATLELLFKLTIEDKNAKVRSGKITAIYNAPGTLSGLEIAKFNAYTNNAFSIVTKELEEEPNNYECQFLFENKSDYMIRLVNADVYVPNDTSVKFVDIDPNEIPEIPAGGKWESKTWTYQMEKEGQYPKFTTKVEFHVVANHIMKTNYKLHYNDLQLAVASIEGHLEYDIDKIPSFKITTFNLTGKVTNTGGALLNEVILEEKIQEMFLPPKVEEVSIQVNGRDVPIPVNALVIDPDDTDVTNEHTLTLKLENLKDSEIGLLENGDEITITYPITAHKPTKGTLYKADAKMTANTYPPGKPIVIEVEPIEINVVHIRHSVAKSKEVKALDNEGEFEITLIVKNIGEFEVDDYVLTEKVTRDLILWDVTDDPEIVDEMGHKKLTWKIEPIPPGDSAIVKYKIKPAGESKVSDTQESE